MLIIISAAKPVTATAAAAAGALSLSVSLSLSSHCQRCSDPCVELELSLSMECKSRKEVSWWYYDLRKPQSGNDLAGAQEDKLTGMTMNGRRHERIQSGTFAEALEWLKQTDGQKRKGTDKDQRTEWWHSLNKMADFNWHTVTVKNKRWIKGQWSDSTFFFCWQTVMQRSTAAWQAEMVPALQRYGA